MNKKEQVLLSTADREEELDVQMAGSPPNDRKIFLPLGRRAPPRGIAGQDCLMAAGVAFHHAISRLLL
jgi:hypothetical protein